MKIHIISATILTALLLLAVAAGRVDAAQSTTPTTVLAMQNGSDLRSEALKNVFEHYNSPLAPFAQKYVDLADKYGIDWKLLPAIAGLESSFGIHQLSGSYNSYGWGGGRIYFKSVEEGIDTVLSSLKNRYFSRGADTVDKIAPIYSESQTWAPRIKLFMSQIDQEYSKLGLRKLALTI